MKILTKILSVACLGLGLPLLVYATVFIVPQGGTGTSTVPANQVIFGGVTDTSLTASPNLSFASTSNTLTTVNASTTATTASNGFFGPGIGLTGFSSQFKTDGLCNDLACVYNIDLGSGPTWVSNIGFSESALTLTSPSFFSLNCLGTDSGGAVQAGTGCSLFSTSTNPFMATYVVATSTNTASQFPFASSTDISTTGSVQLVTSGGAGKVGIATTSPTALFAINPNGISTPTILIGSTTLTQLSMNKKGYVSIGPNTNPQQRLVVRGDGTADLAIGDGGCTGYVAIGLNGMSGCADYRFLIGPNLDTVFNVPTGGNMQFRVANAANYVQINQTEMDINESLFANQNLSVAGTAEISDVFTADSTLNGLGPVFLSGLTVNPGSTDAVCHDSGTNEIYTDVSGSCIPSAGTVNSGTQYQAAFYATSGTAVSGTSTLIMKNQNVGVGTSTPDSTLDVNGSVRFEGNSRVLTASISGAIVGLGCDSADTVSPVTLASTTVFMTTPQHYPGNGLTWQSFALSTTKIRTLLCSDVTVTPEASTYNVVIIR